MELKDAPSRKKDLQKITEVFGGEHEKNFVF